MNIDLSFINKTNIEPNVDLKNLRKIIQKTSFCDYDYDDDDCDYNCDCDDDDYDDCDYNCDCGYDCYEDDCNDCYDVCDY